MIAAGLVDEDAAGVCRVHDLLDHAPVYVAKRMQREAERRARGVSLREVRAAAGRAGHEAMLAAKARQAEISCQASDDHLPGKRTANGLPPAPA